MPMIYIQNIKIFVFLPLVTYTIYECPNISLWPRKRRRRKKGKEYNTEKVAFIFSSLYTGCYFQSFRKIMYLI